MGYEGARLAPLFSPVPARRTARRMTIVGSEEWKRVTVANTPIDDSPFPSRAPGTARESWRVKTVVGPIHTLSVDTYLGGLETEDDVALFLEIGTGLYGPEHRAYVIKPKDPEGWLRFYSRKTGQWVYAKQVLHPGIHPQRPLATAAVFVEHNLERTMRPLLAAWIREQESLGRIEARRSKSGF